MLKVAGLALVSGAAFFSATPSWGGEATGSASVTIVSPLAITSATPLDFGALRGGAADGAVVVSPAGAARASGGARLLPGIAPRGAHFTVSGAPGRDYRINLPRQIVIAAVGPDNRLLLASDFSVLSETTRGMSLVGRLDASGSDAFSVGVRLTVPAHTPPGVYRIDLPVSVDYF